MGPEQREIQGIAENNKLTKLGRTFWVLYEYKKLHNIVKLLETFTHSLAFCLQGEFKRAFGPQQLGKTYTIFLAKTKMHTM